MNNFKGKYLNALDEEIKQFLLLCVKKDAQILLSRPKKTYSTEYIRLACICMAFGYKKILLRIVALTEKNIDCFLKELDNLNGNFAQVDKWVTEFIKNIVLVEARELACEYWQNRKKTLDCENFNIKQLLKD